LIVAVRSFIRLRRIRRIPGFVYFLFYVEPWFVFCFSTRHCYSFLLFCSLFSLPVSLTYCCVSGVYFTLTRPRFLTSDFAPPRLSNNFFPCVVSRLYMAQNSPWVDCVSPMPGTLVWFFGSWTVLSFGVAFLKY